MVSISCISNYIHNENTGEEWTERYNCLLFIKSAFYIYDPDNNLYLFKLYVLKTLFRRNILILKNVKVTPNLILLS